MWIRETVDANVASGTSLDLDASGNPRVGYIAVTGPTTILKYAGGMWTDEPVIITNGGTYYPSLALDASGNPHISSSNYDSFFSGLAYARKAGNSWDVELVDESGTYFTGIALDASGNPHVGYQGEGGERYHG